MGLRQQDLATQLDVLPETVCNWEMHVTTPWPRSLLRIIQFLGYVPYDPARSAGERLRYLRRCLGYSQEAFARAIGVDPGTLRKWEHGISPPDGGHLKKIITRGKKHM